MIVLDTHVLLWWVNDSGLLSTDAKRAINKTLSNEGEIIVSTISAWEVSMLINKERLILSMDIESWFDEVSQIDGVRFLPVDNEIGIKRLVARPVTNLCIECKIRQEEEERISDLSIWERAGCFRRDFAITPPFPHFQYAYF